jgi:hypothetical protein
MVGLDRSWVVAEPGSFLWVQRKTRAVPAPRPTVLYKPSPAPHCGAEDERTTVPLCDACFAVPPLELVRGSRDVEECAL